MAEPKRKIVILGAGLAGLSCAFHLKRDYEMFEKEKTPGGLCRSKKINGFTFDYDGHLLHFRNEYTKALVTSLIGDRLIPHRRDSWIRFNGRYIPYPFQSYFLRLPKRIADECLNGFLECKRKFVKETRAPNFRTWVIRNFGEGIARYFMIPYNEKFWCVDLRELTYDWADRFIPRVDLQNPLTHLPSPHRGEGQGEGKGSGENIGYNWKFWYPRKGIEELVDSLTKRIKPPRLSHEAKRLDLRRRIIEFKNGKTVHFEKLISTIPLPELSKIIIDMPASVKKVFRKLRHNSIIVLNLGIDRPGVSKKHWIYFPEKRFIFYRVGFPMNFSPGVAPSGKSSLYAEVAYSREKLVEKGILKERIVSDLTKAEILGAGDRILAEDLIDIEYGYPIYDRNYRRARDLISHFLAANDIFSVGRYGSWIYMSMEDVILDGKRIAESLFG